MNESTLEELEKLGNRRIPKTEEERKDQNEEKLCKSIIKGLARRHREKHAIFAEIEEGKQHVMCIDDVTGKELPWHEVRKARGQELKYLCDFGAYEKVDEREAIAQCHFTPVDTKWVDTDESFEGESCKSDHELLQGFKSDDRPDLCAGTPPLEALRAISLD